MPKISRFRTPMEVQKQKSTATAGASGRVDLTNDANWCRVWSGRGELIAITAKETVYAQQPIGDITHRVTLRKSERTEDITPKMRVKIGSRKLNITKAIEVGNPARLIELSCTEVV